MSDNGAKFAKNSVVDILIPEASSVDIEDTLGTSEAIRDLDDTTLVTSIAQRTLLFFGKELDLEHMNAMSYLSSGEMQMNSFPYM